MDKGSVSVTEDEVRKFILDYFAKNNDLSELSEFDELDYIKQGYIDSFSLLRFVFEIEENFKIELSPDEVATRDFRKVGGVIKTIMSKF